MLESEIKTIYHVKPLHRSASAQSNRAKPPQRLVGETLMFAAHFAAGLALKGRAPRAPLPALILGAFVLDGLWIVLSVLRIDRTYYDDWSHSLVMSILWASLFSLFFWRLGRRVMCVLWLAVFSHFALDLVVQGASVCPPGILSMNPLVVTHYRLLQLGICTVLLS